MKRLDIAPEIEANADLADLVRRATDQLEIELGRSSGLVSARWGLEHDEKGRPLLSLQVSDWTGNSEATFAPAELRDLRHLGGRMNLLWGRHLMRRSHQLLEHIQEGSGC